MKTSELIRQFATLQGMTVEHYVSDRIVQWLYDELTAIGHPALTDAQKDRFLGATLTYVSGLIESE